MTLRKYLDLEKLMLEAEAVDEGAAEALRERMDEVWYALADADRDALNEREAPGPFHTIEAIRVPATTVFVSKPVAVSARVLDDQLLSGWRSVA